MPRTDNSGRKIGGRLICLGAVSGAFGIGGEVRLKSFTEPPENLTAYGPLTSEADGGTVRIKGLRPIKGGFAARIEGIEDRTGAEGLKGLRLCIERDLLPEPEPGEFYLVDLVGLDAEDETGGRIGEVTGVFNFGAGDILEIAIAESGKRVMMPFNEEVVPLVDRENNRLLIRPPEGVIGDRKSKDGET